MLHNSVRFMAVALALCYTNNDLSAGTLDLLQSVMAGKGLTIPQSYADGRIPTLNGTGANTPATDTTSRKFLAHCATANHVLEIGAGYGLVCEQALKAGCKHYVANDMDERHLQILAHRMYQASLLTQNPNSKENLTLFAGAFPAIEAVRVGSFDEPVLFDALLAARVLHFMNPEQFTQSVQKIYNLLVPGGKVYVITVSPYMKGYAPFAVEFERRLAAGEAHPGYVSNKRDYANELVLPKRVLDDMKGSLYFFDTNSLRQAFEQQGFEIELCEYQPLEYPSEMWSLDGRENTVLIARKPVPQA